MAKRKTPPILTLVILAILALGAVALWDEQRESAAALDDFAAEQSTIAREAAAALDARLEATPDAPEALLGPAAFAIDEPGEVLAFLQRPGRTALVDRAGHEIRSQAIEDALASGARWVRIQREDAASLGLPPRMAIAGLATARGAWKVAIVATALRVRDRERRAIWRLVLGFGLTSALIAAFGALAQRTQKKEIELARSLAISEAMQVRDERLVRADKLATLGALATGIAHEVSTPLGVIVGRAEQLMPRVASDERAKKSVAAIAEQAQRISVVVRSFLRLARGGTPALEKVAPTELGQAALELVEHRFERAHVRLSSVLSPDLPRVACDPKLFEQVLVNLLLNACDACAEGGHVELAVRGDHDRIAFVVTDDGQGITADTAARAAEAFFTTKAEGLGTGLGLAIATEIVKHHHGELTLAPREGARGTTATVTLAAAQEKDDA